MVMSSSVKAGVHDEPVSTSILVQTDSGHALLDPIAAIIDGIPEQWELLLSCQPPTQPYMPAATGPPRKRRKIEPDPTSHEVAGLAHHEEVKQWLSDAITEVRDAWLYTEAKSWLKRTVRIWAADSPEESLATWTEATADLLEQVSDNQSLDTLDLVDAGIPKHRSRHEVQLSLDAEKKHAMATLFHRVVLNKSFESQTLSTPTRSWLVPAQSGFLLADMKDWRRMLTDLKLPCDVDVALLDPPWPSASVRRSSLYSDMDIYDLFKIDLPAILSSLSSTPVLVGVWVTNHAKYRRFVKDKLFRDWKISGGVDWYWVKITNNVAGDPVPEGGLPVFPINGNSPRRCYEGLMLGYYNPLSHPVPTLPNHRAFLSVPLEHSRKPLITDLLRPYVISRGRKGVGVLELFARFVPSGRRGAAPLPQDFWLSVGNEAIKFNEIGRSWKLSQNECTHPTMESTTEAITRAQQDVS